MHHKYSETNADPHNANRGFFFAHVSNLRREIDLNINVIVMIHFRLDG